MLLRTRPRRATYVAELAGLAVPLTAALAAIGIGILVPLASPLLVALVIGAAIGNTRLGDHAWLRDQQRVTKLLLRVGVVLLGLRLPLQDLATVGVRGIAVIAVTVVATFTLTCYLGGRMGLERGLVSLIASGFSICGASAIAAVETGIRRRDEDVALSIAMVTVFGTLMIVVLPVTGSLLGLTDTQLGVWAGASIHEVAQVVAAASAAGAAAVAIATTIKLGRVSMLALAFVAVQRRERRAEPAGRTEAKAPVLPWFVVGFVVAAGVRTAGLLGPGVLEVADVATTLLLACAMFGLGLMMRVAALFPVPWRVLGLATASTGIASSVSLALTLALF
ncbi:YeiH family protein [Solicola gregarius]|uniref:Sulfate exporter family transporter n=1 Tax=Solicola gregarius TaxID=2908642 RepID=A0AA46TK93_9ACTN|nr:putative sulfate exporter family transporter [Solicola gregarius]UYM06862.1 putative sulfate exporter family transporter [Solicola gregarius]